MKNIYFILRIRLYDHCNADGIVVTHVTHTQEHQVQFPAIMTEGLIIFCSPSTGTYWDYTLKCAIKYPSRSNIHNYPEHLYRGVTQKNSSIYFEIHQPQWPLSIFPYPPYLTTSWHEIMLELTWEEMYIKRNNEAYLDNFILFIPCIVINQIQCSSNYCTVIILNVFTLQYLYADPTCFNPNQDHLPSWDQNIRINT
jgi:hypothetical protein